MGTSWPSFIDGCKSRFSAIARSVYLGRQHWIQKYREEVASLKQQVAQIDSERKQFEAVADELRQERDNALQKSRELEQQLAERNKRVQLPDDPPAPGQHYGASMMTLSINLAREVGLRKSTRAMNVFLTW